MKVSMSKARSIGILILFSTIVLSGAVLLASAVTPPPNEFSGNVMLNDAPASVGTVINAYIDGDLRGSIVVESQGKYERLSVSGDSSDDGMPVTFTVGGLPASTDRSAIWIAWIELGQKVDLTAGDAPAGDITPPDITITAPKSGASFTIATIPVSGTASDESLDKVEVKVGPDGDWVAVSGTLTSWSTTVPLGTGLNTIYARANDTAGNSREVYVDDVRYVVGGSEDTTPPTVSITSPSDGDAFTTAAMTISGTASDTEGVIKVQVKVGSSGWVDASGTTVWSKTVTLSQGLNTIDVIAIDTSNISETASITVAYNPPSSGGSTNGGLVVTQGATPTGTDAQPESGETATSTTPTPTVTGTVAPATTSAKEESGAEPEEKKGLLPGFEAMFAIAGLLAVTYLIRNRV